MRIVSDTNRAFLDSVLTFLGVDVGLLAALEEPICSRPQSRKNAQGSLVNYGQPL
jgi:hypothetical protein